MRHLAKIIATLLIALGWLHTDSGWANPPTSPQAVHFNKKIDSSNYKGWSYVVSRLEGSGIDRELLNLVFNDSRMPPHTPIPFKLKPIEPAYIYSSFTKPERIKLGKECIKKNKSAFLHAEKRFGVAHEVIAAIMLVETLCGKNTGRELVINRLARLGSIDEEPNVKYNYKLLKKADSKVQFEEVASRANYLSQKFYPELPAFFQMTIQADIDPLNLRGSSAGAFGLAQFLPSSYLRFAIDGNANKVTSLFEEIDAIHSIVNYLASFGWTEDADNSKKREVIWKYNHSKAYVDTVIKVSILLESN